MRNKWAVLALALGACVVASGCDGGAQGVPPDFRPENFPIPTLEETQGGLGAVNGDTFVAKSMNGRQFITFEAEHYFDIEKGWIVTNDVPGASGNSFVQRDPGGGFDGDGGPFVDYKVRFPNEGTWYVWVRGYTTHADDNGVFMEDENGKAQPVQWCFATGNWHHSSSLRTESQHCGVRGLVTYKAVSQGAGDDLTRVIRFRARDAGFRFDRVTMVDQLIYIPLGVGPPESDRE